MSFYVSDLSIREFEYLGDNILLSIFNSYERLRERKRECVRMCTHTREAKNGEERERIKNWLTWL